MSLSLCVVCVCVCWGGGLRGYAQVRNATLPALMAALRTSAATLVAPGICWSLIRVQVSDITLSACLAQSGLVTSHAQRGTIRICDNM